MAGDGCSLNTRPGDLDRHLHSLQTRKYQHTLFLHFHNLLTAHIKLTTFCIVIADLPPYVHPLLTGCGRLTAVSSPITVRASGSRFGSWMTDAMIPSSDSRVGVRSVCVLVCVHDKWSRCSGCGHKASKLCILLNVFFLSACLTSNVTPVCTLSSLATSFTHFLHTHTRTRAHSVQGAHIKLVVKATVSQLPGVIYIAMVTLACSLLELFPGDEKELYTAAVSQLLPSVSQLPVWLLLELRGYGWGFFPGSLFCLHLCPKNRNLFSCLSFNAVY